MTLRVLLIEDQVDLAASIWDFLERRRYVMDHAVDGLSGLRMALSRAHDAIILDLGLPRLDGLDLCRELRLAQCYTPVLMLTARDTLDDKLKGFAHGADDYLIKPFAMSEMEARLQALHRRTLPVVGGALQVGPLAFDPADLRVRRGGRTIELTRAQGRVLEILMRRSPRIVPYADLADALWGPGERDVAAIHTHLYELRQLVDRPFGEALIRTVRGVGYRLSPPDAQ